MEQKEIKQILENKKARFEYELLKKYDAGIVLEGNEIKEIINHNISLSGSWVKIYNGEAFLVNCEISQTANPVRDKKLLLTKKELKELNEIIQKKGLSLIPTKLYLSNNILKLEFCEARGKKLHDKRETIKNRDIEKNTATIIKNKKKM